LCLAGLLAACGGEGPPEGTPPSFQPAGSDASVAQPWPVGSSSGDAGAFTPGQNPVVATPGAGAEAGAAAVSDGGGSTPVVMVGADGFAPLTAPLPPGKAYGDWTWVDVAGAKCRDGSPAGYYWRRGKEAQLLMFMNGGGACADPFFCGLNPKNVNEDLPSQSLIDATGNVLLGADKNRQVPPDEGIFKRDPRNPVGNWNMIYMPYCTGDIFAGSKPDGTVPGFEGKQQFVGYTNVGLFLESFGPSFANAGKALLTGSSAGSFGALVNYDRTQVFFDKYKVRLYGIADSGIPMRDQYMFTCLQKRWRELWNLDAALPKDCKGCFRADGGGITEGLGTFLFKEKYADRKVGGLVSAVEDGVMRAFFGAGLNECTTDPGTNTIFAGINLGGYGGAEYRAGLKDTVEFIGKDNISTFFLDTWEHMHIWRARYYEPIGGTSIAQWVRDAILAEKPTHVGSP
jgi:hypothetical protein